MQEHPYSSFWIFAWQPVRMRCWLILLLLPIALVVGKEPEGAKAGFPQALHQALELRDRNGATSREQKAAHELLLQAAGVATKPPGSTMNESTVPGYPYMVVKPGAPPAALRELANSYMMGKGVDPDQQLATELFRLAAAGGDTASQGHTGMRLAFGLQALGAAQGNSIKQFGEADEAAALVHYTFGAAGGDTFSRMALGYRHYYGLGVPQSCWTAAAFYQPVAEAVLEEALEAGGLPHIERLRLNLHAEQGLRSDRHREVLQWYQYSADQGNVAAQAMVGQVLNAGTHGISRDHSAAAHYLQRAGGAGDAEAMANLGSMYVAGMGVDQDYEMALSWFRQAVERHDKLGLYSLGYMHLAGKGVPQRFDKAFKYFSNAAEGGDRDSHFFLGVMHLQGLGVPRKSTTKAFMHFIKAAQSGHSQAMYNAAMMQLAGQGTQRSCKPAVVYLKLLAEKGAVAAELQMAHEHFFKGHYVQALLYYLRASEMGLEFGQSNAAWMLDRGYTHAGPHAIALAAQLYRRSAEQGNVVSLLQLGDKYYYGSGVGQDWVRAAAIYYEAYDERSAEAMFNLGFMHEFGAGVPQDLKLAERFYDMCKHTMPDAALPVHLAKSWLRAHEVWEWLLPRLPVGLQRYAQHVFVLHPASVAAGAGGGLLEGFMPRSLALHYESMTWRIAKVTTRLMLQLPWELLSGEFGDTVLLVLLLLFLWVVLKIRRQRQLTGEARGQEAQQQQPQQQQGLQGMFAAGLQGGMQLRPAQPAASAPAAAPVAAAAAEQAAGAQLRPQPQEQREASGEQVGQQGGGDAGRSSGHAPPAGSAAGAQQAAAAAAAAAAERRAQLLQQQREQQQQEEEGQANTS